MLNNHWQHERTPEEQAEHDLLTMHLREAVRLGFSISTPGSCIAAREAFPELFARDDDCVPARHYVCDYVELDHQPLISRADDGYWISAWVWVATPVEDETITERA